MPRTISGSFIGAARLKEWKTTLHRIRPLRSAARRPRFWSSMSKATSSHTGRPGEGYDWPLSNHGITVDYKGNSGLAAMAGEARARRTSPAHSGSSSWGQRRLPRQHDLEFTQDGKFLMQIGKPSQSKGSNDVDNSGPRQNVYRQGDQ